MLFLLNTVKAQLVGPYGGKTSPSKVFVRLSAIMTNFYPFLNFRTLLVINFEPSTAIST